MGGREVNTINTVSKIHLSKKRWEGGGSTSIWIMSLKKGGGGVDGTPKVKFIEISISPKYPLLIL